MPPIVYKVETEVEDDGRWIAEVADLPGVMAYGATEKEAASRARRSKLVFKESLRTNSRMGVASRQFRLRVGGAY
jgi:predicted RNase H-like HicB family nuclease